MLFKSGSGMHVTVKERKKKEKEKTKPHKIQQRTVINYVSDKETS